MTNNTSPYSDYLIFVDESGDHSLTSINPQYPVFVLCFCIIRKDIYSHQITPAIRDLKCDLFGHDLVILHEHDIRKKSGDFNKLGKAKRDELVESLGEIIDNNEMTIIAVVIDKPKHLKRYSNPYHVYHLALMYGMERVYDFMKIHNQGDAITHVIFESRGKKEDDELELEFRRVCDGRNASGDKLPFDILIKSKLSNSEGLQLADLTARPIGLSVIRPNQSNRAFKIIQKKLFAGQTGNIDGNGLKVFP